MQENERLIQGGYTVKETGRIYGITAETLYYYERLGLVVPERDAANGYRLYGPQDFAKLNVITTLRSLDFSLDQIGRYLSQRSFRVTLALIDEEVTRIDRQSEYLARIKRGLLESLQKYSSAMASAAHPGTSIVHEPVRHCALVNEGMVEYEDIPYAFARYTADHHESLQVLSTLTCYRVDTSTTTNGWFPAKAMLLYSPDPAFRGDYDLPAGSYASYTFAGSFSRCKEIYDTMVQEIDDQGYKQSGDPLEFCLIGEYESSDFNEYVSKMQIPVEKVE